MDAKHEQLDHAIQPDHSKGVTGRSAESATTTADSPPPRRKRGRPALIDAEKVCSTALEMGVASITMTSVAARLGVNHATLYRYVSGRTDLVKQAIDMAVSRTEFPEPNDDWRAYLHSNALAVASMLTRYPGIATELASGIFPHSVFVKASEIMTALMANGFNTEDALLVVDMIMFLVIDHCRLHEQMDGTVSTPSMPSRKELSEEWPDTEERPDAPAEVTETIAKVSGDVTLNSDQMMRLRRKLAIAVAGIEHEITVAAR